MIYKLEDNEWALIMWCFQKHIQKLSPVVRTMISCVLSKLESEKTITEIDQANAIISLLSASIEEEPISTDLPPEQTKHKVRTTDQVRSNEILILLDSLRFFLQYETAPDKCKQIVRQKNS